MSSSMLNNDTDARASVHARLEEVVRELFNDDGLTLTRETTAEDIPDWDSLAHINLMFALEQRFGIQFPGDQFGDFKNIGELEDYLLKRGA